MWCVLFCFFKQKTAYEMRISDWSSDVCSSDLQTRGDLYRQMKELFDAYFLADTDAREEYDSYTVSIERHFQQLDLLAVGEEEHAAIQQLRQSYDEFTTETIAIFDQRLQFSSENMQKKLNSDIKTGIFPHYESVTTRTQNKLS